MATSSKVQFKLSVLKEKALEAIDFKIAQQEVVVQSFDDDAALETRISEWRARQEERVSDLFRSLADQDNHRLAKFEIDPIPTVDRWDRQRAERDLNSLRNKRSDMLAKSESLVPDESGNIALTKTQLSEFFGL